MAAPIKPEILIEASLFSAGRPLSIAELADGLGLATEEVQKNIRKLRKSYSKRDSALEIIKAGSKYGIQVRPELAEHVMLFAHMEIPMKVLKTAALIAYHQPIKQSDLQDMFGSKVYDHVKELHELGLIRKREEGRTTIITTTKQFSEYFGIDTTNREKIKQWLVEKVQDLQERTGKNKDPKKEETTNNVKMRENEKIDKNKKDNNGNTKNEGKD
jgi:segregation and condensation protein B